MNSMELSKLALEVGVASWEKSLSLGCTDYSSDGGIVIIVMARMSFG